MFDSCRKRVLVKRITQKIKIGEDEVGKQMRRRFRSILAKMETRHIEAMLKAIANRGESETSAGGECALVMKSQRETDPAAITCRIFRWPQTVTSTSDPNPNLRMLPFCSGSSGNMVCGNPYHWSLVSDDREDLHGERAFWRAINFPSLSSPICLHGSPTPAPT